MHDSDGSPSDKAVHQISERLARAGITGLPLPPHILTRYRNREFIAGWELQVQFADEIRKLHLLVPQDAPWSCSRVALVEKRFQKWPHVESDGVLCLRPNTWTFNPELPGEAALEELVAAAELIDSLIAVGGDADFREEFCTYWNLTCNPRNIPIFSIVEPSPQSRLVYVWRGRYFTLIGDSPESIAHWLRHRFPEQRKKELTIEQAGLIWLDVPPTPSKYPNSVAKLKELSVQVGVDLPSMLDGIQSNVSEETLIILAAQATSGTGFIGVSISRNKSQYFENSINKGYRKGKVPHKLIYSRLLNGTAKPCTVERADASWVHGRDQDTRQATLQKARVAILGCGSVGAYVANLLASAGVGNLFFVDPEGLTWANVGRHVLGAEFIGQNKAESLAQQIGKRLPHINQLESKSNNWQAVMRTSPEMLSDRDLLISMMGDWSSECQLNAWQATQSSAPPILYGWAEAYCCAGHAVAIYPGGACLQCGFSPDGVASFQVGSWSNNSTIRQEPACGADFQPYGPVELMHICAMISEFALDCLIEPPSTSEHRVWAGSQRLLESTGGQWTQQWQSTVTSSAMGSRLESREWPKLVTCPACGWRSYD